VLHAVRRCWASLFGARPIRLRDKLGSSGDEPEVAVIVQRQIDATRSGVIVTTDGGHDDGPLTVEASYGLGESVVTGLVSPDVFAVEKSTLRILARDIHYKALLVEQAPPSGGIRRRPVIGPQATCPALLDREVRTLAELGERIERHYDSPQVVEWALDRDGRTWVLQSEPVD
jgi:pyruvate,water dikinase